MIFFGVHFEYSFDMYDILGQYEGNLMWTLYKVKMKLKWQQWLFPFIQGENEVKVATLVVSLCTMDNELMNEDFHQLGYRF